MYANRIGFSDVTPFEVIERTGKTLTVREMNAEIDPTWKPEFVQGGFCAHCINNSSQRWIITSDITRSERKIRLHKDGKWKDNVGNNYWWEKMPQCKHSFRQLLLSSYPVVVGRNRKTETVPWQSVFL